jgi:hypothetical protein
MKLDPLMMRVRLTTRVEDCKRNFREVGSLWITIVYAL